MEDTVLYGQFWANVKNVLKFTKPIYNMIHFACIYAPVIGEAYEQMNNMLGQVKDIVQPNDPSLYDHIYNFVCAQSDKLNVPLHALAIISLCQNNTLHLGWENLHLGVVLGPNPI